VLLRVRFAEVSRSAMSELGASFFSDGYKNYFGRVTTQQFPAPDFDSRNSNFGTSMVFSD
jgi:Flp pilus assembly secretin CpaC